MPRLHLLDSLPPDLLAMTAPELATRLPGPTLVHLPGRHARPLFVSVLLHGNEDTGWDAVREVLQRYQGRELPRAMSLFIGNIHAAAAGVRTLPGQSDFNRVWPGTCVPEAAEAAIMADVVAIMRELQPFASIDIHNNTGLNPHYACLNRLDTRFFHLARLFSRIAVYFSEPVGVQSMAMAELCPAVTVECGKVGSGSGVGHAAEFLEACLHLDHFPEHALAAGELELLQTVAILKVPEGLSFSFDGSAADIRFRTDIDTLNFTEAAPGTLLGRVGTPGSRLSVVPGVPGESLPADCVVVESGSIRLGQRLVPAMLTRDPQAVRLDCLCYLMRRIDDQGNPVQSRP
ncbi:MAG: M14 family metallopeptidase [Fluviicoccus sp.]|uniref:M14 family metallopeptidase n=1 Tax=Fluviicoccus sp. TaxID=2003552 RepID=UPI002725A5A3|nr:M14 family metallopeptidase [Fluviicoccus sp.]MDO8332308.1 M14 family metallopeptidase [Fluviicoccus sp.]